MFLDLKVSGLFCFVYMYFGESGERVFHFFLKEIFYEMQLYSLKPSWSKNKMNKIKAI